MHMTMYHCIATRKGFLYHKDPHPKIACQNLANIQVMFFPVPQPFFVRSFSICIWRVPHPGSRAGSTPRNRNDRLPTSNVRHPLAPQSAPLHLLLLHISKTNWSKIKQTIKCRLLQRNQADKEQLCYRYFDFKKSSCTVCLMFQADFKLYQNQPFLNDEIAQFLLYCQQFPVKPTQALLLKTMIS